MAAWCAAAGRQYNEDNFLLKDNLSNQDWHSIKTDNPTTLDEKGVLLVVCDGMGGMNAGEIASDLAVKTIQEWFAADRLTPKVLATPETMMQYVEQAIIAADFKIKEDGKQNREHEGMGSTIVLAWIVGKNVYVGWCGDSRAYRFNPAFGLVQLTHDHSYVQELVDAGRLLEELAFDHPDSNIITRSLGDDRQKARPDVKCYPIYNEDVILLCTDGLSGVLRDKEIETIISKNTDSMENCRKALWAESETAGWTDNVTITLCQILSGAGAPPKSIPKTVFEKKKKKSGRKKLLIAILTILLLGGAFQTSYYFVKESGQNNQEITISGSVPDSNEKTSSTEDKKGNKIEFKKEPEGQSYNAELVDSQIGNVKDSLTIVENPLGKNILIKDTGEQNSFNAKIKELLLPKDTTKKTGQDPDTTINIKSN